MTFEQIETRIAELAAQLRGGQITPEQYAATVNQLRITDTAGYTWQPNPAGQGWLYWDGTRWQPGTPVPPPASAPPSPTPPQAATASWQQFRGQLMSPQMFSQVSREVPLRHRPQAWWDVLAILGGAICGYFWFVYAAVRGLPRLSFVEYGENAVLDFVLDYSPIAMLLLAPVLLIIFRRLVMPPLHRFFTGMQGMSAAKKVGCVALLVIVLFFMHTNNFLFTKGEGLDLITPVLMLAIPLGLVWFRKETDRMLLPFEPYLRPIPLILLSIVALAIPFLVGYLLCLLPYIREYNLLRLNVIIGVLLSYAILRRPESTPTSRPSAAQPVITVLVLVVLYVFYDLVLNADTALAHDFLTDPFNLKDGLRTTGIAPLLSGVASVLVTLLVNGPEILRNIASASAVGVPGIVTGVTSAASSVTPQDVTTAEPAVQPKPEDKPKDEAEPPPDDEAKTDEKPEPKLEAKPEDKVKPEDEAKPLPETEAKPEDEVQTEDEPKPDDKAEPPPEDEAEPPPEDEPKPEDEVKTEDEPKPPPVTEPKPEDKTESKPEDEVIPKVPPPPPPPPVIMDQRPSWMPKDIPPFQDIGKRLLDHAPERIKNGTDKEKARYIYGQQENIGKWYGVRVNVGGWFDAKIEAIASRWHKGKPQEIIRGRTGMGSCGAWANAFSQMLEGAGVRNTVIMTHKPGYDASRTSVGVGSIHTDTQTAVLVDPSQPGGKSVGDVYDSYMNTKNTGGHFKNSYRSQFNGQNFEEWKKWNDDDGRTQIYNSSAQDNPKLDQQYQQTLKDSGKDFISNREFKQCQLEQQIKNYMKLPKYQSDPSPERLQRAIDVYSGQAKKGVQGLTNRDIQQVLSRIKH